MKFNRVAISGLSRILPPQELTSQQINARLGSTRERLGMTQDVLEGVAGIRARRLWTPGTQPSEVATQAARKALDDARLAVDEVDLLINTSVSRDFLEPATASIIAGSLGVSSRCQSFDLSNACLGFLNGMDMAAHLIQSGAIRHALIVAGETAEPVYEATLARLETSTATAEEMRDDLAALTLGSGAAAMVMAAVDPEEHTLPRYRGGLTRSATQHHTLCRGNIDRMTTDTKGLLQYGMQLALQTFQAAQEEFGWAVEDFDEFVVHQVSRVHTLSIMRALKIDSEKLLTVFQDEGNIGPVGLPIVLNRLREDGRLGGKRVAMLGIGSGLNCTMAAVQW